MMKGVHGGDGGPRIADCWGSYKPQLRVSQKQGYHLVVPAIRIIVYLGLHWGPPHFEALNLKADP